MPPPPLVGPHSCLSGLCRPLVFCPLSSFLGCFLLTPGFCHLFIPLFFWPGEASMVPLPRPVTLSFSVHLALTSVALWPICPLKAAICIYYLRTWFHRIVWESFSQCTVRSIGHPRGARCPFLIPIVKSPIYVGRLRTASYTPLSVLFLLDCQFPLLVFVGLLWSLWSICSFSAPLPRVFSPGSSPCCSVFLSCVLLFFVGMFSSASALMS